MGALRKIGGKILLILDGSPIQRVHEIKDFLKRGTAKRLQLEQLPSPNRASLACQLFAWQLETAMQEKGKHMQSVLEPEPHHQVLHHRLKDSFAPTYLTALSVIQGVALADLGSVVVAGYQQFTIVQWLLVVFTFLVLIIIWNQYAMQSSAVHWVPDFRDAAFPFMFGALELMLNHTIRLNLSAWLVVLAVLMSWGALVTWYSVLRAKEEDENAQLLSLLNRETRLGMLYTLGISLLFLLLAIVSRVGSLEATDGVQTGRGILALGIVLLAGAGLCAYVLFNIQARSQMVAYARTGRIPGIHAEDSIK